MERCKIINAFQLKLLMTALMLLDHLHYLNNFISPGTASVFNIISRCAAPMFAFLAVEGIRHTRNLKKYCIRLSISAVVMFIGNYILRLLFQHFTHSLPGNVQMLLLNNIFFTLALGVLTIAVIQQGRAQQKTAGKVCLYLISVVFFSTGFLFAEWGSVLMPFMLIEYFFHEKKVFLFSGYILIEIIAILLSFSEPLWFLVFPFILLYNGERGPKTNFSKYFFYVFYPAHLWIIALIDFMGIISAV